MEEFGYTKAGDRLKQILISHNERWRIYGNLGTRILNELYTLFEEFVAKELDEIEEEILILSRLGDELDEERREFEKLKKEYEETNQKLVEHLKELKQENPPDLDWELGFTSWGVVGGVNDLRRKVDRWTKRELRDYDRLKALLDEELRRRGVP